MNGCHFKKSALDILRDGYREKGSGGRAFQLLVMPSFASAVSIEAYLQGKESDGYLFVRMVWKRDDDYAKLRTPFERLRHPFPLSPAIRVEKAMRKDGFVDGIIRKLESSKIPIWVDRQTLGLDGTSYELLLGDIMLGAHYRWWETPPVQWKPLAEIAFAVQECAEKVFVAQQST